MKKLLLCSMLVFSSLAMASENREGFDPSDPTKPQNFWLVEMENTKSDGHGNGNQGGVGGIRIHNQGSAGNLIWQAELPVLKAYGDTNRGNQKFTFGDSRLRTFYITHKSDNPDSFYQLFAVSLDTFLPTGSVKNGTGSGMYKFVPSIVGSFKVNEKFSLYPIVGYGANVNSNLSSDEYDSSRSQGISAEVVIAYNFTPEVFLLTIPRYSRNERASNNNMNSNNFSIEFNLGYMLDATKALGIVANIPINNEPSENLKGSDYMYNQETIKLYYQFSF